VTERKLSVQFPIQPLNFRYQVRERDRLGHRTISLARRITLGWDLCLPCHGVGTVYDAAGSALPCTGWREQFGLSGTRDRRLICAVFPQWR